MLSSIISFCLVFFYIFCFSFSGGHGIDSSKVVAIILLIHCIVNKPYRQTLFKYLRSSYLKNIAKLYIIANLLCVFTIIVNTTMDFSFMKTFLHMFVLIIIGIMLFSFLEYKGYTDKIVTMIILSFLLQTLIEWTSFLIPQFKEIINFTKSEETIAKGISYGGIRANALSGSDFFGLSAGFAVVFMIYLSKKNKLSEHNRILKILLFVLLLSGTFFAGRTGFVGFIVAILYLFISKNKIYRKGKLNYTEKILLILCCVLLMSFIDYCIYLYNTDENFSNLFYFAFENIFSLINDGTASTGSMQSLNNMYFSIDFLTLILGDGQYTVGNGYYMGTDVGYMRPILFFGIFGFLLLLVIQCNILRMKVGDEKCIKRFIFLLLLILSFKGEVIVWNQIVLDTIVLFCLQDIFGSGDLSKMNNKSKNSRTTICSI